MTNHERIKLAFGNVNAPKGFADRIISTQDNITMINTQQTGSRRINKVFFVAAAIILTLGFTITAIATDLFGFRSIFEDEAIAPFIVAGDNITGNTDTGLEANENDQMGIDITVQPHENEVDVKLLAAFFDETQGGGLYLQFEIHDPTGTKLSDSIVLILHDEATVYTQLNMDIPSDIRQWMDSDTSHSPHDGVQIIDAYTVRADFFIPSWKPIRKNEAGDITVRFDLIATNVKNTTISTGFNIGEHLNMDGSIALPGAEFIQITGVELNGRELTIFHSDTSADPKVYGWGAGTLSLIKSNGETIGITGGRNHFLSNESFSIIGVESYFGIGNADPNDLTLVWRGDIAQHILAGNWEFTIATGNIAIQPGLFEGYYEEHRIVVNISTDRVNVHILDWTDWAAISELFNEDSLVLYLADGTTVLPKIGGAEGSYIGYDMDFINPGDVIRVIFRGVEIGG